MHRQDRLPRTPAPATAQRQATRIGTWSIPPTSAVGGYTRDYGSRGEMVQTGTKLTSSEHQVSAKSASRSLPGTDTARHRLNPAADWPRQACRLAYALGYRRPGKCGLEADAGGWQGP